jgi:hypothetical protein
MRLRAIRTNRRGAAVAAALAVAAMLFHLPAEAEHEACPGLQATYLARPDARAELLATLQAFGCTVPNTGTSTSSTTSSSTSTSTSTSTSSTSTSIPASTTSTTVDSAAGSCAVLQADYLARPDLRPQLLLLLQLFNCQVPTIPSSTTSTTGLPTTTSSTTSTSTSSTTTSSTSSTTSTSTTVQPAAVCPALQEAYVDSPTSRPQLLVQLRAFGCAVPVV